MGKMHVFLKMFVKIRILFLGRLSIGHLIENLNANVNQKFESNSSPCHDSFLAFISSSSTV